MNFSEVVINEVQDDSVAMIFRLSDFPTINPIFAAWQ